MVIQYEINTNKKKPKQMKVYKSLRQQSIQQQNLIFLNHNKYLYIFYQSNKQWVTNDGFTKNQTLQRPVIINSATYFFITVYIWFSFVLNLAIIYLTVNFFIFVTTLSHNISSSLSILPSLTILTFSDDSFPSISQVSGFQSRLNLYGQRPKYFIAFSLYYNLTNKRTKEYNRIYLMHERKPWSPQEDDLIRRSIKANGLLKWKKILTWIKNVDPNFSRNSKQMRERWKFHLDPNLIKQQWSEREEEILFKSHMLKGSRWKEIQKLLPGRSEKSIKNYFYMTLRKSLRRVTKMMGVKNSTDQTRQLKANVLTKIVESANQNPQKRQSIYRLFNLHKLRNGQCKKANILEEDIIVFRELMDDILKYNELYTINKKMGLSALEEKITSLKSENCVTENVGDKSTVAGRSTVPGLLSDPDIDIEEEGEQFEEDQAPNQVRDGQPNMYEQYTFLVEGQSMKDEDLFSP